MNPINGTNIAYDNAESIKNKYLKMDSHTVLCKVEPEDSCVYEEINQPFYTEYLPLMNIKVENVDDNVYSCVDLKNDDDIKMFICTYCKKQFHEKRSIQLHLFAHFINKKIQKKCKYKTNSKYAVKCDVKLRDLIDYNKRLNQNEYNKAHDFVNFVGKEFNCDDCSYTNKIFECFQCGYKTNLKFLLERHVSVHIDLKPYKCNVCNQSFRRKDQLQRHKFSRHTDKTAYECSACDYKTNIKHHFQVHLVIHEDVRPYKCNLCSKQFKLKQHLNSHNNTHSKETEFHCTFCNYQCNTRIDFIIHLKDKHLKEKKQKYKWLNKKKRKPKVNIDKEKTLNDPEKKFKCLQCDYQTNNSNHLKRHRFVHGTRRPLECDICHHRFIEKAVLRAHIANVHTKKKEYKCSICNYETNNKYYFKRHMTMHDKKQMDLLKIASNWMQ